MVYNDASKSDLGCVLMQDENVITYTFQQFKDYEKWLFYSWLRASRCDVYIENMKV